MGKSWKGFYKLLDQYQRGTINPIKKQVIDFWYDSLGDSEIGEMGEISELGTADQIRKKNIWENVKRHNNGHYENTVPVVHPKWWNSVYIKLAAACVVILIGFFSYKLIFSTQTIIAQVPDSAVEGMLYQTNHGDGNSLVKLPDGSTVSLMHGATLYYPNVFGRNERKVYLKGDGIFNVTPDKKKPFLVYSDHIITRVVGTSFSIKQKEKGSVEVAVLTGIVKVQKNEGGSGTPVSTSEVILTQNKKVTFYPGTSHLVTGLVEQPAIILAKSNVFDNAIFDFRDAPISDIIPLLEKAYGVRIELSNMDLGNCTITADVSHPTSLFEKLDILTEGVGAEFKVVDDKIILSGGGCKSSD